MAQKNMPAATMRFIVHWGEMGNRWGVNRSVAQVHALLYLSDNPLAAEEISETLGLARSNVSNSIKDLTGFQLIRRVHLIGDRLDRFEAETDLWEMMKRIVLARKQREIDPTIEVMNLCVSEAKADKTIDPVVTSRLIAMLEFMTKLDGWVNEMAAAPKNKVFAMIKMGRTILKFVGGKT